MIITFSSPITVGDLANRITIPAMRLKSFSFNFAGPKGGANVLISITLTDPVSGYDQNYVYEDAIDTPSFCDSVMKLSLGGKPWIAGFLERLQADGKLPAGTLS